MDNSWIKVYTSSDFFRAEMVKQVLTEHEIDAVILNKQGYPYNIGEIEVYVRPELSRQATELIVQSDL